MHPSTCTRRVVIIVVCLPSGLYDSCVVRHHNVPRLHWAIAITAEEGEDAFSQPDNKRPKFSFRLRSHKSYSVTTLSDVKTYAPNVWTHLAATFDGDVTHFYVDGAKVESSSGTWGELFRSDDVTRHERCLKLRLGGDHKKDLVFRGEVWRAAVFARVFSQAEVVQRMRDSLDFNRPVSRDRNSHVVLEETFEEELENWRVVQNTQNFPAPIVRQSNFRSNVLRHDIGLSVPPCGVTVCDDPEVIRSYVTNAHLRSEKRLRYRVINIARDDGSEPLVSDEQMRRQHEVLNRAFQPHNISFQLSSTLVLNETLRDHKILYGCKPDSVGNGICDEECDHELTGNDGGDCDVTPECESEWIGDGVCDAECNRDVYDYDDGDCCRGPTASTTCFDPKSHNRCA